MLETARKAEASRASLTEPMLNEAALTSKNLDRQFAAVLTGHLALEHFLDVGAKTAVIFKWLRAIPNVDPCAATQVLIVRGLVGVLELSPAADVIDEDD